VVETRVGKRMLSTTRPVSAKHAVIDWFSGSGQGFRRNAAADVSAAWSACRVVWVLCVGSSVLSGICR
jgi:hypothetical protein